MLCCAVDYYLLSTLADSAVKAALRPKRAWWPGAAATTATTATCFLIMAHPHSSGSSTKSHHNRVSCVRARPELCTAAIGHHAQNGKGCACPLAEFSSGAHSAPCTPCHGGIGQWPRPASTGKLTHRTQQRPPTLNYLNANLNALSTPTGRSAGGSIRTTERDGGLLSAVVETLSTTPSHTYVIRQWLLPPCTPAPGGPEQDTDRLLG